MNTKSRSIGRRSRLYNARAIAARMAWQIKEQVRLMPDSDIFESAYENNRDLEHLGGKFSR